MGGWEMTQDIHGKMHRAHTHTSFSEASPFLFVVKYFESVIIAVFPNHLSKKKEIKCKYIKNTPSNESVWG